MWKPSTGVKRDALCNGWAGMLSETLPLDGLALLIF